MLTGVVLFWSLLDIVFLSLKFEDFFAVWFVWIWLFCWISCLLRMLLLMLLLLLLCCCCCLGGGMINFFSFLQIIWCFFVFFYVNWRRSFMKMTHMSENSHTGLVFSKFESNVGQSHNNVYLTHTTIISFFFYPWVQLSLFFIISKLESCFFWWNFLVAGLKILYF